MVATLYRILNADLGTRDPAHCYRVTLRLRLPGASSSRWRYCSLPFCSEPQIAAGGFRDSLAMPTVTNALSVPAAGAPSRRSASSGATLRDDDVRIDIAYAGICHSDIHTVRDEWGAAHYPIVTGHEIAGTVSAVGEGVTAIAVGDRVGWAAWSTAAASAAPARTARRCSAPSLRSGRTTRGTTTVSGPPGLQPADRRHRADGGPDPRRALARRRRAAALRGITTSAAEALGRRAGRQGRRRRGGRPGTWA